MTHEITADLVRELLRDQHPDLADRPLRLGARGWDNQLWRLGDDLAVRAIEAATALAGFLSALHHPAPGDAPTNPYRGGPLTGQADGFAEALAAATARGLVDDPAAVRAVWDDAVTAPAWTGPTLWLHADLHPANVLTADGALCGVIDFGDLCVGDPAYDLAAGWLLLPDEAVHQFHSAYRPAPDAATVRRARGWAAARALGGILIGDNGVHGRPGGKTTWGPPAHAALRRLTAPGPA
ncbi:phosphotransferase [Micromonospora sp. NPDC049240]|uniref:phosphotransferase n=1 Tax=Micromonospora sp. NPDC049240 TaxID=3155151 RepID=UPI00340F4FA3